MEELDEILKHFGVKGMKWGVRKEKDRINSTSRTIKKGTEIQNITSREYRKSDRHMYSSYTSYDKEAYIDMMGNFMYNEGGYKNSFVVKKDIRVPSDKQLVDNFVQMAKSNPKRVAREMSAAYNDTALFTSRKAKHFEKKISKIKDADSKRGEKLTKEYVSLMVSNKAAKTRAEFFGGLIKQGFDAMSDVNDRNPNAGTQDPLIIFNPSKTLGNVKSVKLTKQDLDRYHKMFLFPEETKKRRIDLSEVQR